MDLAANIEKVEPVDYDYRVEDADDFSVRNITESYTINNTKNASISPLKSRFRELPIFSNVPAAQRRRTMPAVFWLRFRRRILILKEQSEIFPTTILRRWL